MKNNIINISSFRDLSENMMDWVESLEEGKD